MSSLTMVLAVSAANRKDDRNTKLWLIVTATLGGLFLAGQVYEFTSFYREGLGYSESLFASSFYTLTGFHGVHVAVGIILLMSLMGMILRNRVVEHKKPEAVEMVGPVLALRRRRLDHHLHPRLPHPGLIGAP